MVAAPSEKTKEQKDNMFLFMRIDISHKSLNNTTLFLFVPIFKNSIHRLSFMLCVFLAAVSRYIRPSSS